MKSIERLWLERALRVIEFQVSSRQGCQLLDRAACGAIQSGLEYLLGWGVHNLFGQHVSLSQDPFRKKSFPNI